MDTLRRVGSIRKSMRKQQKKQTLAAPDTNPEDIVPAAEDEPVLHPSYFTLTCSDAVVTASTGSFQPTHLRVVITRHRKTYVSNPVLWESSLKCHLTGAGVWHPPFVVSVSVSPPMRSKSKGTLRHKDAFVSLENVDLKGRRKLLARARVNLSDYYVAASVSPVAFKLKLFPESSKISGAFVHFSVHRTDADPTTFTPPVDHDECDVEASPMVVRRSSHVSSHYDEDSDDDFTEDRDKKFPPKKQSPVPAPRPSTLTLKNPITVKQPVLQRDNNNDAYKTSSATVVANRILETTSLRFSSSSAVVVEQRREEKVVSVDQKKNDPEPARNRLLAEPEDSEIDTPKKVVSGILLPSGPPPPLPQRTTASNVSSQRSEKTESSFVETKQV